ncbi:MAG: 50S ribosome-binding GTPase [Planctomycetes bacterium]|nr:50S ribosome-binding GTPase [Planctomycetota bacterium]
MSIDFQTWAAKLQRLHGLLRSLAPAGNARGIAGPAGQEWFELLERKLLPQATAQPWLVVAAVGGTNIGKSLIFNLLAGENASAVSPLAAGTRHPVCLTPPGFDDELTLGQVFTDFTLRRWQSADDSLGTEDANLLFWRAGRNVPPRLLLLDTPDVDSDAPVNWQRADAIRQSADVLLAVLTQQKYNDAAVKQFFRRAAAADKPVIVIFNQCDVPDDAPYWPLWLETFCRETGVTPELVYVVPHDRAAANELRLPFYDVGRDGRQPVGTPGDLRHELAALHFDAIKIRTFRGALTRVLDREQGCRRWLDEFRHTAAAFDTARRELSLRELARLDWPTVPTSLLVDEIVAWWDAQRAGWLRSVHGAYRTMGNWLVWPAQAAWRQIAGEARDPIAEFHQDERLAVVETVEAVIAQLERLANVGNDILRPRLQALLAGHSRVALIEELRTAYEQLPEIDDEYRQFLRHELETWQQENPRARSWLRSIDVAAGVARPAITISLAVGGGFLAADVVHQAAVQAAGHTATQWAADAAITSGVTVGGEALVSLSGQGMKQAWGRLFLRLQTRFAEQRARWLAQWLEAHWLRDLFEELRAGAELVELPAFHETNTLLDELSEVRE